MNGAGQTLQDKMQALREAYLQGLEARLDKIEHFIATQERRGLQPEERAELQSLAHKISGTGATYGFPAISAAAATFENWLIHHPDDMIAALDLARRLCDAGRAILRTQPGEFGAVATPPLSPPSSELPLLLIVDDDAAVRDALTCLFDADARILTGANTNEALELMARQRPDLVLLDDMMPGGVSGLCMLENRRAMPDVRDIPVIMITASKKPEDIRRGLRAGAVDYIAKPFDPADVVRRIQPRLRRMATKVLIADADARVRETLDDRLRAAGLKTVCAADEDEAWHVLRRQTVALAISDSVALAQKIRSDATLAKTPVIFLASGAHVAEVARRQEGFVACVAKPFHTDDVVLRCLHMLELSNHMPPIKEEGYER